MSPEFTNKKLKITSRIQSATLVVFIILCAGLYKLTQAPTFITCLMVLVFFIIIIFLLFAHDSVELCTDGDGVITSKIWQLNGPKKYKKTGLLNVKAIVLTDISGDGAKMFKQYLLFDDGYMLPLPDDNVIKNKIILWFKKVYELNLEIKIER